MEVKQYTTQKMWAVIVRAVDIRAPDVFYHCAQVIINRWHWSKRNSIRFALVFRCPFALRFSERTIGKLFTFVSALFARIHMLTNRFSKYTTPFKFHLNGIHMNGENLPLWQFNKFMHAYHLNLLNIIIIFVLRGAASLLLQYRFVCSLNGLNGYSFYLSILSFCRWFICWKLKWYSNPKVPIFFSCYWHKSKRTNNSMLRHMRTWKVEMLLQRVNTGSVPLKKIKPNIVAIEDPKSLWKMNILKNNFNQTFMEYVPCALMY